jgi:hypothetical protein
MDVAVNFAQFAPYLIGGKICLYYQRRNHTFYPQAVITINPKIIQFRVLFSDGTPEIIFSILLSFTTDMNYQNFIKQVIRGIYSINKWPQLIDDIMERLSHSSSDF